MLKEYEECEWAGRAPLALLALYGHLPTKMRSRKIDRTEQTSQ